MVADSVRQAQQTTDELSYYFRLIEADGGASSAAVYVAATMCRRVAAQNTIADRLTAAPSKQTPCQPAWA